MEHSARGKAETLLQCTSKSGQIRSLVLHVCADVGHPAKVDTGQGVARRQGKQVSADARVCHLTVGNLEVLQGRHAAQMLQTCAAFLLKWWVWTKGMWICGRELNIVFNGGCGWRGCGLGEHIKEWC